MRNVEIVGSGPAGASAALAAIRSGSTVRVFDKSRLPRHKVCGEFLSPEIGPLLDRVGVYQDFINARPAVIRRMTIHLGRRCATATLPEPGWGLSRYCFDHLLFEAALRKGASFVNEPVLQPSPGQIWAVGRQHTATRGGRLFGFKAHYDGPIDDAVELFFFRGCYVGINSIEHGLTNVCGLAPEEMLDPDDLVASHAPLADRLRSLSRKMNWLTTGPLVFSSRFAAASEVYRVGDALSFVDPFTGSGLLNAVLTGTLAGECAAADVPVGDYLVRCRRWMEKPSRCAAWLRNLAGTRIAQLALPLVPGKLLFRLTRVRLAA